MNSNPSSSSLHDLFLEYLYLVPIIIFSIYIIYQRHISPLSRIPGPFLASLSNYWLVDLAWKGTEPQTLRALHEKHGPLVRTGPNQVDVADLQGFKKIYGAGSAFVKSDWYNVFRGSRKFDLAGHTDEKIHGIQRKLVARAYTMDTLKDLEPYVDTSVKLFMEQMGKVSGQKVDMGYWLQLFAFGSSPFSSPIPSTFTDDIRRRYRRRNFLQVFRLLVCGPRRRLLR